MNVNVEKRIGQNIKRLREKRGMTREMPAAQMQVAGCDLTRSALAKIEVGQRHAYPDEILCLKSVLQVPFDEIFSMTD